jgi:hypothetical protein
MRTQEFEYEGVEEGEVDETRNYALEAVTTGVLRTMSRSDSLKVSKAVDALLARRSEMHMEAPAALVLGELAVRIRCEPPYLLPHVCIRPRGALGKRINHTRKRLTHLPLGEQMAAFPVELRSGTAEWKGMASAASGRRDY